MSSMSVKTSMDGPPSPLGSGQELVGDRQLLLDEPARERGAAVGQRLAGDDRGHTSVAAASSE